jgi:drug/metabolite transporter (DMT)-like permease
MRHRTVYLLMFLHVTFAAVNYVLAKAATRPGEFPSVETLTMARAAMAAVLLLGLTVAGVIPRPHFAPREWLKIAGLGLLLVPLNQYMFLRGLRDIPPGHAALIYAMTPLGVLIYQFALARRFPPAAKALGVALAFAGVMVVMRPWSHDDPDFRTVRTGDAWIAVGAVVWVVYTVSTVPLLRSHDPRTVTAWSLIAGAVLLVPFAGRDLLTLDVTKVSAEAWWGLASLVVLASCVMMLLWNFLLRHLQPVEVSICTNAQPIATTALTALLPATMHAGAHSDAGPEFWTGTALVVTGVALAQRRGS